MHNLNIFDTVKELEHIDKLMEIYGMTWLQMSPDRFKNILRHLKNYEKLYVKPSEDN